MEDYPKFSGIGCSLSVGGLSGNCTSWSVADCEGVEEEGGCCLVWGSGWTPMGVSTWKGREGGREGGEIRKRGGRKNRGRSGGEHSDCRTFLDCLDCHIHTELVLYVSVHLYTEVLCGWGSHGHGMPVRLHLVVDQPPLLEEPVDP